MPVALEIEAHDLLICAQAPLFRFQFEYQPPAGLNGNHSIRPPRGEDSPDPGSLSHSLTGVPEVFRPLLDLALQGGFWAFRFIEILATRYLGNLLTLPHHILEPCTILVSVSFSHQVGISSSRSSFS